MINMKMRRILIAIAVLAIAFSCASKRGKTHDDTHQESHKGTSWHEMDQFHAIMRETFHPFKDSANLEPAKTRAAELLDAANKWAAAPLPMKVDDEQMRSRLQQLTTDAATLAESVRSADDNVIASNLTALHDTFHAIQDEWYRRD